MVPLQALLGLTLRESTHLKERSMEKWYFWDITFKSVFIGSRPKTSALEAASCRAQGTGRTNSDCFLQAPQLLPSRPVHSSQWTSGVCLTTKLRCGNGPSCHPAGVQGTMYEDQIYMRNTLWSSKQPYVCIYSYIWISYKLQSSWQIWVTTCFVSDKALISLHVSASE